MNYGKIALTLALTFFAACAEPVPSNPTWFGEVRGILAANCLRCHAAPAANAAPAYFRLDRFVREDGVVAEEADPSDAFDMAQSILIRTVNYEAVLLTQMPPDSGLSDRQKEILTRWVANDMPKGTRDNRKPKAELLSPSVKPASVDQELSLKFRSYDEDGDGLIVSLGYRPPGESDIPVPFVSGLLSGISELTVDTGLLASQQRFDIVAILDDGFSDDPADNQHVVVVMADLLIDHGEKGTAPSVTLDAPNGGDAILGITDILWTATDPDPGDVLRIDLDLIRLDAEGNEASVESIAMSLPNTSSFSWDSESIAAQDSNGLAYKIRVTASDTDNKNIRSDDSDASFSIVKAGGSTEFTWESDIKPFFVAYCGECHGASPVNPNVGYFRLDMYDATEAAPRDGVFEVKSLVYQRLVLDGNMPQMSSPQPSVTEVAMVKEWIEAGAPFAGGSADAAPTFVWTKPAPASYELASSASYTLMWTANDPEDLPPTGRISMAQLTGPPPPNMATATCDASTTGFSEIVSMAQFSANGNVDITLPNSGFFCFKGEVTDEAGQSAAPAYAGPVEL